MISLVRQTVWDAELARSEHFDKILVQNLEVTVNAGKDVWGRKKKQRALISVTVTLEDKFASASSTDTVDNSTIHYGILSKAIQARFAADHQEWMSTSQLSSSIAESVRTVAGSTGIHAIETNVRYLKGCMFGDGAGHITSKIEKMDMCSSVLYLHNVRIPCLIGVNSNERLQKQPVVVNLWIDGVDGSRIDDYPELESLLFSVCARKRVANIIADSHVANICN
jgi:dihydroneopterin aldolase